MLQIPKEQLPRHVALIMDGNGRWAKQRGLSRSEGHKQGAAVFRTICEYGADLGIAHLTFYAFSTENWSRPKAEVDAIMDLFRDYLHEAEQREEENLQKGMRLRFIGEKDGIPPDILQLVQVAETRSRAQSKTVVNLAVNYGGRNELLGAVKALAAQCEAGEKRACDITEDDIAAQLYTAGQPDPDLIIRPSGENRLSNFLLWQSAYAEFWGSSVLWPDFTTADFDRALLDYASRSRRFGGI